MSVTTEQHGRPTPATTPTMNRLPTAAAGYPGVTTPNPDAAGSAHDGELATAGRDLGGLPPGVGFIGLGDMGGRIARRILAGGFPLTVFDTRATARDELAQRGAVVAERAELVGRCGVVGICVVDDQQLRDVTSQLGCQLVPRSVVLVHSSVLPQTVIDVANDLAARDVVVIDAPVSGSRPAADAGTLTVMAGGDWTTVERLRPLLDTFAANVVRAGQVGAGQALKIANNVMLHMNHLVALEAVRFARSQGVDEATLIATANASSGRSWVTETWGLVDAMMIDHPLAGTDAIYPLMSKELWHSVELGRQTQTALPLTALGTQLTEAHLRARSQDLRSEISPGDDPTRACDPGE
jgi:3-hydroxyisobutyrate dehydrogenase